MCNLICINLIQVASLAIFFHYAISSSDAPLITLMTLLAVSIYLYDPFSVFTSFSVLLPFGPLF